MTTASNWSYMNVGGAASDTLFVYSTGNTKTYTGNAYKIFINDYGAAGLTAAITEKVPVQIRVSIMSIILLTTMHLVLTHQQLPLSTFF